MVTSLIMAMIHRLFLDENGHYDPKHHSDDYTVTGIICRDYQSQNLKVEADQIKYKYWNDTSVVFHSRDIGKRKGDFSILRDPKMRKDFYRDLYTFLNRANHKVISVSMDKRTAVASGLTGADILRETWKTVFDTFLEFLSVHSLPGQIVIESSGSQDIELYKLYTGYLIRGYPPQGVTPQNIKSMLTSLSFVSKHNQDTEAQVADLYAYISTQVLRKNEGKTAITPGSYEEKMSNILQAKIVKVGAMSGLRRI